ncbi:uncharacterized protein LOC123534238 [Mercenaria mercenaria]|uniref:uncharacterized protein LOC123534238 n=1 Tax=Mercenaria mercenaria TaxID=6596 RepID=UPI00234F7F9C|nr:uncharacterized protein LOC123534238 [Mercenaria mercenaria]
MNTVLLIGIAVTGAALLISIVATSIPFWWRVAAEDWDESINFGLFQFCRYTRSDEICMSYISVSDWLRATQAMMIMCILSLAASGGLSLLFGFVLTDKTSIALAAAFVAMAGAFFGLLGVIIYGAKMSDPDGIIHVLSVLNGSLHAGFGLAAVAVVLAMIAPVLVFCSRNSN